MDKKVNTFIDGTIYDNMYNLIIIKNIFVNI